MTSHLATTSSHFRGQLSAAMSLIQGREEKVHLAAQVKTKRHRILIVVNPDEFWLIHSIP